MPKLKPWFHVVTPREDLRENRPLDASEFAVNLDLIRDGKARKDYQDPRAAASRCEFRVDWGPVSEYALVLLYSATLR